MKKITKKELKEILEQHTLWLDSNEKEGKRADLFFADLTCVDLSGVNLTDTILDEKEQYRKGIVLTEPITGYKKSNEGKIITLEIPIGAKVFSINNKKRRSNKANVIDMQGET